MKIERKFYQRVQNVQKAVTEGVEISMYHFARWRNIFQKIAPAQHVSAKERVNTRRVNDTELIEG